MGAVAGHLSGMQGTRRQLAVHMDPQVLPAQPGAGIKGKGRFIRQGSADCLLSAASLCSPPWFVQGFLMMTDLAF